MALPLGTWKANINGLETDLIISGIDPQGRVSGSVFGVPIRGLWNDGSQTITFTPALPDGAGGGFKYLPIVFTGYMFATPVVPLAGQDVNWTITGVVRSPTSDDEALGVAIGTARRNEFGWLARITQVV